MTRPQTPLALAGLAALLALTACGGGSLGSDEPAGSAAADSSPVDIGLLVPTSGVYAPLGEDMANGFRLYLTQKAGKLGGRTVNLQTVDEGESPDTGVPGAQRLIQQEVDAVVGIVNSATALGVRDAFEEAQVPLIVANAGADAITGERRSDYVWRTSFSNGGVASALGPHAAETCTSAFLMASDYAAGKEAVAGFERSFTGAGGKVAGKVLSPFGTTTNYQPFLAQATSSGADCVYSFFAGAEAVAFTRQYRELGLKPTLLASGFQTEGGVLTAAGQAAVGIETSLHYSDQLDNPRNREFVTAYRAAYNEPPTVYAVQAYDAAQVLDKALAGAADGPAVVKGLQQVGTVDSPRGSFTFDEGHGPKQAYYLRTVEQKDGALVNAVRSELTGS
ncbi:MAG TPA: ABC transporter substrate-binding protein [Mycobacteriales bacterium]|jgi:branched-chain amino acid transport system substrate-binding protein|nr:ABC transporter substrate-binding protein [Mycobacteriales bacterium]